MEKDFLPWHELKTKLQKKDSNVFFSEGDIWLCSIGLNLGHEEDGKRELFLRPVIVFKKFNADTFWGIPLTSRLREGSYYHQFIFANKISTALLLQMRSFDKKRFIRKIGTIPHQLFSEIRDKLLNIIDE